MMHCECIHNLHTDAPFKCSAKVEGACAPRSQFRNVTREKWLAAGGGRTAATAAIKEC